MAAALACLFLASCASAQQPGAQGEVTLTIRGHAVLDAADLQAEAEAQLAYTLDFGYVARVGAEAVRCWFARGEGSDVEERLWCGPVQVPGTAPAPDWVPVPLKEVERTAGGVRMEVQPPQVPASGSRSVPNSKLVRTDGAVIDPSKFAETVAGQDFLAVLPDDGKKSNAELGLGNLDVRLRDDLLSARATGWANPDTWPIENGMLTAATGTRLRVLRLHVDKLTETDSGFKRRHWQGFAPQPSELALEVPGKRHLLPADRLPANGSVLVVYTVPTTSETQNLVLNTLGAKSLEQRVEVPSGKRISDAPPALQRAAAPAQMPQPTQPIKIGDTEFGMKVVGVRLGRQRPVRTQNDSHELVTASAPDKALLEVQLNATGNPPTSTGGAYTKNLITVTLPDGSKAPQVGARYDGDVLPFAVIVEVPADVRSVSVGLTEGTLDLPILHRVTLKPLGPAVSIPLDN